MHQSQWQLLDVDADFGKLPIGVYLVDVKKGESIPNVASTKHRIYGPAQVLVRVYPEQIKQEIL